MSTNPLERIPKRSPKTSVTDLNEFAKTAGSTAASAAYPIMLGLTGEDTGDKWYEDLAYGDKVDNRSLRSAINNSANPTKTLEFLLNSENVWDVVENMLTTTNYGHIGRVPYTADARRDGLQAIYKRTLPEIYNVSYRESIDNGATDAEAREYALDAVKYWMKERSAEGASQGHISVGDLIGY